MTTKVRDRVAPGGRQVVKHTKPEQHLWQAWGSDPRFHVCACGATRRADYLQPDGQINPNPCVQMWGPGPAGATCKTCVHLFAHKQSKTWYKCGLRPVTHGAKTDLKLRWDACKRYELKLLRDEAAPDADLDARGAALSAYMAAFHQARAELDAHNGDLLAPLASGAGRQGSESEE